MEIILLLPPPPPMIHRPPRHNFSLGNNWGIPARDSLSNGLIRSEWWILYYLRPLYRTWLTKIHILFSTLLSIFLSKDPKRMWGFAAIINLWSWTCDPSLDENQNNFNMKRQNSLSSANLSSCRMPKNITLFLSFTSLSTPQLTKMLGYFYHFMGPSQTRTGGQSVANR